MSRSKATTIALLAALAVTNAAACGGASSGDEPGEGSAPSRDASPAAREPSSAQAAAPGVAESFPVPAASPAAGGAPVQVSRKSWAEIGVDNPLYEPWARVLETYVDEEGLVDYDGLTGAGRADMEAFVNAIGAVDPDGFASENEEIAFWINAYNAVVVWQVVERYPLESVRDLDRFFGLVADFFKQEYRVAGADRTLDNIEHDILRPKFGDSRIHWTLVCGAFGCPRLLLRPYVADDLDPLLTELSYEFLSSPRALQIDRDSSTLHLSSYFDWYGGDFEAEAGDVVDYVLKYAPEDSAAWIRANRDSLRVRFIDYDWTLNDQTKGPRSRRPVET